MKYHFTPTRMAIRKKMVNDKCWQGCGETESLLQCWLEYKMVQLHWKIACQFFKLFNRVTIWPSYFTPRFISRTNESIYPHKNFHGNNILILLHSNVLHNSQKEETTQTIINWWVYKQSVVYPYNIVLFGNKGMKY